MAKEVVRTEVVTLSREPELRTDNLIILRWAGFCVQGIGLGQIEAAEYVALLDKSVGEGSQVELSRNKSNDIVGARVQPRT